MGSACASEHVPVNGPGICIREFRDSDYEQAFDLWKKTENLCLGEASGKDAILRYLKRNPAISSVAESNAAIIGTILVGHDGYRAYVKFLAVDREFRGHKIANSLIERSFKLLKQENIEIVYLSIADNNQDTIRFWSKYQFGAYSEVFPEVQLMCRHL